MVDWQIVATLAAPVLALFLGVCANRRFKTCPVLLSHWGHVSSFNYQGGDGKSGVVNTPRSVAIRNTGRHAATNVRLSHTIMPGFCSRSRPRTCWRTSTSQRSLEEGAQFRAVNGVNYGRSDAYGFALRVLGQGSGSDEQSFVRATNHRTSEIASFTRSDRGRILYRLHWNRSWNRMSFRRKHPGAVDAAVAGTSGP